MKIGIDVDLTTLKSDEAWWTWLWHMSNRDPLATHEDIMRAYDNLLEDEGLLSYDLSEYFGPMTNSNVHPMDFWRNEGVYDTVQVRSDAYVNIRKLIADHPQDEIIFVTHNKGNGSRSKYNLLARLFGKDNFSYVITREKYNVLMDILIDDRHDFLNRLPEKSPNINGVCIHTPFKQTETLNEHIAKKLDWYDVYRYLDDFRANLDHPF